MGPRCLRLRRHHEALFYDDHGWLFMMQYSSGDTFISRSVRRTIFACNVDSDWTKHGLESKGTIAELVDHSSKGTHSRFQRQAQF